MRRFILGLITVVFLSAIPATTLAQSNDPFEQETLKATGNSGREKKVSRKKAVPETKAEPVQAAPAPAPQKPEKKNDFTMSNSCNDWLDVEFVSLIGSIAGQNVQLTIMFTNHDVNKHVYVGNRFIAYDCEGNEHERSWSSGNYNALTDIPIKTTMDVPGKINPSKTKVMPVIKFDIGDCKIEMRNVPIEWK